MVIQPALVWVEVPPRVADQFRNIIEPVEPSWGKVDPESLRHVTLFDHYITKLDDFSAKVLQGRTRLLRASAIFAAMLDGHLDRVTLRHTMGVSMPTILQLERLLSVDLHRRLDPGLVEARNAHITGQVDD
jgi:Fe-S-cluster formation regulator IscX/YfhJ